MILYERIDGNGKLTETENVIFYVSYTILTDERNNSYVLLKGSTEIWLQTNGNVTLDTARIRLLTREPRQFERDRYSLLIER